MDHYGIGKLPISLRYVRNWIGRYGVASGTNTYTLTLQPNLEQYKEGQVIEVKFTNANTGASTININGLGAKTITNQSGAALSAGDIAAGGIYFIAYDGTNYQLIGAGGGGASGSVLLGTRNIFVSKQGVDADGEVGNLAKPFLTIGAAIAAATALIPSASNKFNIVIYSGTYTEDISQPAYVNLISAVPVNFMWRQQPNAAIIAANGNALNPVYINGNITQTGTNNMIYGINCNSLIVNAANGQSEYMSIVASTAITNTTGGANDTGNWFDVHSLVNLADTNLGGTYQYCTSTNYGFAASGTANAKNITGLMYQCHSGIASVTAHFASAINSTYNGGNISGILMHCRAYSANSFGSSVGGDGGVLSGTFENCRGQINCYGSSATQTAGTLSGTLIDCIGGDYSFVGSQTGFGGVITGNLTNCNAVGHYTYASGFYGGGVISGNLYNCIATGNYSYCSANTGTTVSSGLGGRLVNCRANGNYSFASVEQTDGTYTVELTATMIDCIANGSNAFMGGGFDEGSLFSGSLTGCEAYGDNTFGSGGAPALINNEAKLINCKAVGVNSFGSGLTATAQIGGLIGCYLDGCIAIGNYSFGSVLQLISPGTAQLSGATILNCTATGNYSFGSADNGDGYCDSTSPTNKLINCIAVGNYSFCSQNGVTGVGGFGGTIENCIANGDASFCSSIDGRANNILSTASLINCIGGDHSFASSENESGGVVQGKLVNCVGGTYCFGSTKNIGSYTNAGIDPGAILLNCKGTTRAFGFSQDYSAYCAGTIDNCDAGTEFAFNYTVFTGLMRNCRVSNVSTFNSVACGSGARFEYCSIKGDGVGSFALASWDGNAYNIDARFCSFFGYGVDPLLTIVTAIPYNTNDVNSLF